MRELSFDMKVKRVQGICKAFPLTAGTGIEENKKKRRTPMEQRLQTDLEHLYRLTKSGKSAQEIMQELNIAEIADLQNAMMNLVQEKGEETRVPGLIGSASINPRYNDEGIRISPEMLSGSGFEAGDQFRLKVSGDKIILEKKS
jgi:hypothetical protein